MKCSCEDQVVVCRELLQASLEFALVDEAAGLVYDYEGEDSPREISDDQELLLSRRIKCNVHGCN